MRDAAILLNVLAAGDPQDPATQHLQRPPDYTAALDKDGLKEPVRITYSDGFDGLPVPSPDGKQMAWTSSRAGGQGAAGQIYLAQWNHEAAMAALKAAPPRQGPKK